MMRRCRHPIKIPNVCKKEFHRCDLCANEPLGKNKMNCVFFFSFEAKNDGLKIMHIKTWLFAYSYNFSFAFFS